MRILTAAFVLSCALGLGCERFQEPTDRECQVLVEHMFDVYSNKAAKENNMGPWARLVLRKVGNGALDFFGERKRLERYCSVQLSRYEVKTCLKARTVDELKQCVDG